MGKLATASGLEASWEKDRNVDSRSSLFTELAVWGAFQLNSLEMGSLSELAPSISLIARALSLRV
jgi:hypothetical protein